MPDAIYQTLNVPTDYRRIGLFGESDRRLKFLENAMTKTRFEPTPQVPALTDAMATARAKELVSRYFTSVKAINEIRSEGHWHNVTQNENNGKFRVTYTLLTHKRADIF